MPDIVVTCPKPMWKVWLMEGDLPGDPWSGHDWMFSVPGHPRILPGERVYIVANGKLRGYAPLVRVEQGVGKCYLIRRGDAVAVTIDQPIKGFRGFRYVWWARETERPFPKWRTL